MADVIYPCTSQVVLPAPALPSLPSNDKLLDAIFTFCVLMMCSVILRISGALHNLGHVDGCGILNDAIADAEAKHTAVDNLNDSTVHRSALVRRVF